MENVEKVLVAMRNAGKPLKSSEIEALSGLSKSDVEKAMKQLKGIDAIVSPQRCFWEPKK